MAVDFNIEVRKKQLESLDQYLNFSKSKVQSLLEKLGWSSKTLLEVFTPLPSGLPFLIVFHFIGQRANYDQLLDKSITSNTI